MRSNPQLLFVAIVAACADASELDGAREVEVIAQALSPCSEVVPADRNVDGIPAYAQCEAVAEKAIFSNNGVDTSTTQLGPDWVRTQYGGGYQCTELAGRYMHFKWGVKWRPNGNAGMWCDAMPPSSSGLVQTMDPVHGDVMVLAPSSCGAAPDTGHVTVVDLVGPSGKLTVVEQNGARRGTYKLSCAKCFLHAVANDGTNPGNEIGEATTTQPAAAGSAAPRPTAWRPPAAGAASQNRAQGGERAPTSSAPGPSSSVPSQSPPSVVPSTPALAGSAAPASSLVAPTLPSVPSNTDSTSALGPEAADNSRQTVASSCSVSSAGPGSSSGLQAAFAVAAVIVAMGVRRRRSGCRATPTRCRLLTLTRRVATLLVLMAAVLTGACAQDDIGTESRVLASELEVRKALVVGGEPIKACQWPSTVMLDDECTGTLIHPRVVTTAAHCIRRSRSTIQFGVEAGAPVFTLEARCQTSGRGGLDWGYCILPEDERVAKLPVTPPLVGCEAERFLKVGASGWIVGFGDTGPEGRGFGVKRHVEVTVNGIRNGIINVGDREVGACHGDSGGPIYMELKENGVDYGVRVFGSTQGPGGARCDCTCSTDYVDIRLHVAAIERDEGIDVTPCTDADGAWDPSPACANLLSSAATASGTYPECSVSRTQLPIASCGQPGLPAAGAGDMGPAAGATENSAGAGGMAPPSSTGNAGNSAAGAFAAAAGSGGASAMPATAATAGVPAAVAPMAGTGGITPGGTAGAGAQSGAPSKTPDSSRTTTVTVAMPISAAGTVAVLAGAPAPAVAEPDERGCSVASAGAARGRSGAWWLTVPALAVLMRRTRRKRI